MLPEPTQVTFEQLEPVQPTSKAVITMKFEPPPYGHRKGFIPRAERDFGDGGAFPEIPVVQFPLVIACIHYSICSSFHEVTLVQLQPIK